MDVSCQCGSISFKTPQPDPIAVYICHCNECRRQSGSAYGISVIFPAFDLPTSDRLGEFTRSTQSGKVMHCYFCKICGSRLVHARDGVANVSVKGGCIVGLSREMLDGALHIWAKEAIVDIPSGAEQIDGEPDD